MSEELRSVLLGTAAVDGIAVVALVLTIQRGGIVASASELRAATLAGIVAWLAQAAHFGEEVASGFHQRYPELLGLAPWPLDFFVGFNLFWIAVWGVSLLGLPGRHRVALFPLWLLGIAGLVNLFAHPAISLLEGGYFPGLATSPIVGLAGILLLRRLALVTSLDRGAAVGEDRRVG